MGYNIGIDRAVKCYVSSAIFWSGGTAKKQVMFVYLFLED